MRPAGNMPDDRRELVRVYRTPNVVAVRSLALVLEDAGIQSQIVGDFRDGAYAGLNIGSIADKELWIAASDEAAAAPIIARWRSDHDPDDPPPPHKFQFSLWAALIAM